MLKSSFSYVPALYRHLGRLLRPENSADSNSGASSCDRRKSRSGNHPGGLEPQATLYTPFWHAPLGDWLVVPPLSEEASAEVLESHLQALSAAIADQLQNVPFA